MSTRNTYEYRQAQEAKRRHALEVSARKVMQATARAEHARLGVQVVAREMAATQKLVQSSLDDLESTAKSLAALGDRLAESRAAVDHAAVELAEATAEAESLAVGATQTADIMARAIHDAQTALGEIRQFSTMAAEGLTAASLMSGQQARARQHVLESEMEQAEAELRFLTSEHVGAAAATVTLVAMKRQGYVLRATQSKRELEAWFEREADAHRIAVSIRKPARPGASEDFLNIDLDVDGEGEECLSEMDDLETAIRSEGLGELSLSSREYPRDDRAGLLESWNEPQPQGRSTSDARKSRIEQDSNG